MIFLFPASLTVIFRGHPTCIKHFPSGGCVSSYLPHPFFSPVPGTHRCSGGLEPRVSHNPTQTLLKEGTGGWATRAAESWSGVRTRDGRAEDKVAPWLSPGRGGCQFPERGQPWRPANPLGLPAGRTPKRRSGGCVPGPSGTTGMDCFKETVARDEWADTACPRGAPPGAPHAPQTRMLAPKTRLPRQHGRRVRRSGDTAA